MTEKEVAALRDRTDEHCYDGEGINVTKEDVARLLEERETLLAAAVRVRDRIELRADSDWCRGESDFSRNEPAPCGDAVALAEIKAAIAKAQAPLPT
jgi:hypothetical protein